jgi:hypothetical protein
MTPELTSKELILEAVLPLFADKGFDGVTMRYIAKVVGMRPASLYHHFADKKSLYLEAVGRVFSTKTSKTLDGLTMEGTAEQRLEAVVRDMVRDRRDHPVFHKIISREIIDGDEERIRQLTIHVFTEPFQRLVTFIKPFSGCYKSCQLVLSLIAMIYQHYEYSIIRRFLPKYDQSYDKEDVFVAHVMHFFLPLLSEKKMEHQNFQLI